MAEPKPPHLELTVRPDDGGQRLDQWLAARLELSRQQVRRLLGVGAVSCRGRGLSERAKGARIAAGDRYVVDAGLLEGAEAAAAEPELPLDVLWADADMLVANKPAGIPVHPLNPGERGTLLNRVLARFPEVQGVGEGGLRSGVAHRLDVGTSGCVAFGRTQAGWDRLHRAFRRHYIQKVYLAIVHGQPALQGECNAYLRVARHRPAHVEVLPGGEAMSPRERPADARACHLSWECEAVGDGASLVRVQLGTGFLHQIRVMFAAMGHPLVGDTQYGQEPDVGAEAPLRPMLHASRLVLEGCFDVTCPLPGDFDAAAARLVS